MRVFFPVIPVEKKITSLIKVNKNKFASKEVKGDVTTFKLSQMPKELLEQIEDLIVNYK